MIVFLEEHFAVVLSPQPGYISMSKTHESQPGAQSPISLMPWRPKAMSMTIIHVQRIGDKALLPQGDFDRLVELARRYEEIELQIHEDDVPTLGIMHLMEQGGAFDFWREEGEAIYAAEDGEPV